MIARKNKSRNNLIPCQEDPYLIPVVKLDKDANKQVHETVHSVAGILAARATEQGVQRVLTPKDRLIEFNKKTKATVLMPAGQQQWSAVDSRPEVLVGENVLMLKPTEPYHIRWPIRRSRLNVHSGVAGSLSSVIHDLETIWSYAITEVLGIPLSDLGQHRVVLVIPDVYNRRHVKELVSMLLRSFGFHSCFIQHESVCATFGAGLSSATVVDVGDQKTSAYRVCVVDQLNSVCSRHLLRRRRVFFATYSHYSRLRWKRHYTAVPLLAETASISVLRMQVRKPHRRDVAAEPERELLPLGHHAVGRA